MEGNDFNFKSHIIFGVCFYVILSTFIDVEISYYGIVGVMIGSLIPDMDHPKSKINNKILPFQNKIVMMIVYVALGCYLILYSRGDKYTLVILGFILLFTGLSKHRTFTHSLVGIGLFYMLLWNIGIQYNVKELTNAVVFGIILHVIADFLTVKGIQLFYPASKKNFKFIMTVSTGGIGELVVVVAIILLTINIVAGSPMNLEKLLSFLGNT